MFVLNVVAPVLTHLMLHYFCSGSIAFWVCQVLECIFVNAGEVINERDRCPQCKGSKVTQEKKVLEVHVEKGMQNGQRIVFKGEADEAVSELRFSHPNLCSNL